MRLFAAFELNPKVIATLTDLVRRLGPTARLKWVHPQNMHVTLKYIGDWSGRRLGAVTSALEEVKIDSPVNVPLAGLGFFPSAGHPRVFWVGAENTAPLRRLSSQVDAVLQPLGIAPEVRPYQPHLTLARIQGDESLDGLHSTVDDLPSRDFGIISPDRFVLFESALTPRGTVYRKIEEFPFLTQPAQVAPTPERPVAARW